MADVIMQKLIDVLLETQGIGDRVGGRIYDRSPTQVIQAPYPLITLWRQDAGWTEPMFPASECDILISVFSDLSTDHAKTLHVAIHDALHARAYQSSGKAFVSWERHPPVTVTDNTGPLVHIAHVAYRVTLIG